MRLDRHTRRRLRIDDVLFILLLATLTGLLAWLSSAWRYEADWTATGRNTLSQPSREVLALLEGPVRATAFVPDDPLQREGIRDLVDRYRRAGAPLYQHRVKTIQQTASGYVVDGAFSAKYLVGAGGTRCPVYRTLFADTYARDRQSLIVTMEQEFPYPHIDARCRLWFMEHGLPGYAWYVPKAGGFVNVGLGGNAASLRANGDRLKRHWRLLVQKLDRLGLVQGHDFRPRGHAYYLRQAVPEVRRDNALIAGDAVGLATRDMGEGIGPAIRSGLLAAEALLHDGDYDLRPIPRLSLLPSLRRLFIPRRV